MKKIGIIGGGFAGTMTAVHLVENSSERCEITIINERETFNKGVAFNPYSDKHLLNVVSDKMSAYSDNPNHFLDWVMNKPYFQNKDRELIANSFLPRRLYGEYITSIWQTTLHVAAKKNISLTVVDSFVVDLEVAENNVKLWLHNGREVFVHYCVIATGNNIPGNPRIRNMDFFQSKNYFQNPWKINAVSGTDSSLPVLIVGNGLTMVDTVLGLLEQGFRGETYSLSPHGFNILPHRHNGMSYTKLNEDLTGHLNLLELVKLVNRHVKSVREFGVSAEPVIDSLRLHTQEIWKNLSQKEKKVFMSRLRHLWGVARHRIPVHTHDKIQRLRIDGKLHIIAGKILDCKNDHENVIVQYVDKKSHVTKTLTVSRVINCTGPETNLLNLENSFLKNCLLKGILTQDELKLGISTDTNSFQVISKNGERHKNLFTVGSNLRGELWESTAVREIRTQVEKLAEQIINADLVTTKAYLPTLRAGSS